MTSWVKFRIAGKKGEIVAKVGGYEGREESDDPVKDIMHANRAWIPKEIARKLKLKNNQKVTLIIAGKHVRGVVKAWSRGSKQIIFDRPLNLTRSQAESIRVDVD